MNVLKKKKAISLYQRQNFGLHEVKSICRQLNNCTQMFCFVLDLVENMVRKRENDGSHKFSKGFFLRSCV